MRSAIDKLAKVDLEAATVLRSLIAQLNDGASRRYIVDPDVAEMLVRAAESLGHLQDTAPMLIEAARRMEQGRDFY
jgi:hypothetical protein